MRKVGAFTVEISGEVDDRYAKGTSKDASLSSQTETEFDATLYEDVRVLAERICDNVHQKTTDSRITSWWWKWIWCWSIFRVYSEKRKNYVTYFSLQKMKKLKWRKTVIMHCL